MTDHLEVNPFDEGGPGHVVKEWLEAIFEYSDFDAAWELLEPDAQAAIVQDQLWGVNEEQKAVGAAVDQGALEAMAAAFMLGPDGIPEWRNFAAFQLGVLQRHWGPLYASGLGLATRPRPLGPGMELLKVAAIGLGEGIQRPDRVESGIFFIVRLDECGEWRIAAVNTGLPQPGWPPTYDMGVLDPYTGPA